LIAISNISLNIILPKLTIENLKLIAKCHKLKTQSKMKSQEIQSIISSHTCDNCQKYVYILKCLKSQNKSDKRTADLLKANKKYQTTNSEIYKAINLESVKKHQAKNSEIYKAAHLESVKKNQAKNSDIYKAAYLESVKKNQAKISEMYKAAHLESVKKKSSQKF
jgi:hypothetical protein